MVKETSCKKLKSFMIEEYNTSKDYFNRGFLKQSRQEKEHGNFFKSLYNLKCKK